MRTAQMPRPLTLTLSPTERGDCGRFPLPMGERIKVRGMGGVV